MTRASAPRPLAIVTGMLGSGKTTMIARLIRDPSMADTLVLVNEFGEIGLDHHLLKPVTDAVVLLPNGCLCCTVREDALRTLREVRRAWLGGTLPDVGRILIETTGLAEPAPLLAAIAGDPLIGDMIELATLSTVVDAQHGLRQLDSAICRNQIRLADQLLLSKTDLVDDTVASVLAARLGALNPLAGIERSADVGPGRLFARDGEAPSRSTFTCDEPSDHVDGIAKTIFRPSRDLRWRPFQTWLGDLLDAYGARLLRLKGRLTFTDLSKSVIIQAVHHHFYPVIEAPDSVADDFLILIHDRTLCSRMMFRKDQYMFNGLTDL